MRGWNATANGRGAIWAVQSAAALTVLNQARLGLISTRVRVWRPVVEQQLAGTPLDAKAVAGRDLVVLWGGY